MKKKMMAIRAKAGAELGEGEESEISGYSAGYAGIWKIRSVPNADAQSITYWRCV